MLFFRNHNQIQHYIEAHRAQLYRLAFAWCHNEQLAEDLVQDTCIKALEKAGQLKDREKVAGWLTRIMLNLHRDCLRKQKDLVDIEDAGLAGNEAGPEQLARQADTSAWVRSVIARLGEEQRKVLTLVDLSDFSYSEVAAIMDIPIGTVMSRLCRARRQLKVLLEEEKQHSTNRTQPQLRRIK